VWRLGQVNAASRPYAAPVKAEGYRTFPVLQKPFHRSELADTLAKLLTPDEPNVESATAAVAEILP
jgi:hypothetical protein